MARLHAERDGRLLAVEHPVVAVALRGELERPRVRSMLRLGQENRRHDLTRRDEGDEAPLLLLGGVLDEHLGDERRVVDEVADVEVGATDRLRDETGRDSVRLLAAVLLRGPEPQEPHVGHGLEHVGSQCRGPVVLLVVGTQPLRCEGIHGLEECLGLLRQEGIDSHDVVLGWSWA